MADEYKELEKIRSNTSISIFTGVFDLSAPVKDIYIKLLKHTSATIDVLIAKEHIFENRTEVKMYLDILVKQKYIEKVKTSNGIEYKAKEVQRKKSKLPETMWYNILDNNNK
jgi:hypothetical protein